MAAMCRNGIALEASGIGIASTGEGVGGLFPQGEAAPLPHLSSPADFFLVPECLNYFPEIKQSNAVSAFFLRQNNARRPLRPPLSSIYFLEALWAYLVRKNVAKFPGGGMTTSSERLP
jgi:hypothetical protein